MWGRAVRGTRARRPVSNPAREIYGSDGHKTLSKFPFYPYIYTMCLSRSDRFHAPLPARSKPLCGGVRIHAPAKINLNLLVAPRQADGFHPIDAYVARIALYEQVDLTSRSGGAVEFACRGMDCGRDEDNLALRMARLLVERCNSTSRPGVDIILTKRIPPGSGLGGGSSDAAAVLLGLNRLWRLGLSAKQLTELALQIGSDVPMFLSAPTARVTGRGEFIEPITVHPFIVVLYLPDYTCRTVEVYRQFDRSPLDLAEQLPVERLAAEPPRQWRSELINQLASSARRLCPALGRDWDALAAATGLPVCMTGSGSALFILCDDQAEAQAVMQALPPEAAGRCLVAGASTF